jgi:hypothetical protein
LECGIDLTRHDIHNIVLISEEEVYEELKKAEEK